MRGMAAGYGRRFGEVLREVSRLVEAKKFHVREYFRPVAGLPGRRAIARLHRGVAGGKTGHSWHALTPGHGLDLNLGE
jgi:hypothetical protein